jgi:hypothetical protein
VKIRFFNCFPDGKLHSIRGAERFIPRLRVRIPAAAFVAQHIVKEIVYGDAASKGAAFRCSQRHALGRVSQTA